MIGMDLYLLFCLLFSSSSASSQNTLLMKRKGVHLSKSPSSYCRSKMTKKSPPMSVETPPPDLKYHNDDYESDIDEDDILSFSDIWCSFDEQDKVRI